MDFRDAENWWWSEIAMVGAMLNTLLVVREKKSIEPHCFTVGYSTWKVSQVNKVQLSLLLLGKKHKSPKSTLWGMMSGITLVLSHPYAHTVKTLMHFIKVFSQSCCFLFLSFFFSFLFFSVQFKQMY